MWVHIGKRLTHAGPKVGKKVLRPLAMISGYKRIATVIGKIKECNTENRNTSSISVEAGYHAKYKN